MPETDLYPPIKSFLEAQGYTVKAEIKDCDVLATRGQEPPLIVELKTALNLQLFYQAVDRLSVTDTVYIAVPFPKTRIPAEAIKLCRRIGVGLIVVTKSNSVEVLADPIPYAPRKNKTRVTRLLKEFNNRQGDPNIGGSTKRTIMTAYRQDAMKCRDYLSVHGPSSPKSITAATGINRARAILHDNHYGWFEKVERGIYGLNSTPPIK